MGAALASLRVLPAAHQAYGPELADRRERSLQHTAERFVQLFLLTRPPHILTLEQAATALIGAPQPPEPLIPMLRGSPCKVALESCTECTS